ncbi:MAG: regulatory protein RecX [Oscillospiraceae bacterium]
MVYIDEEPAVKLDREVLLLESVRVGTFLTDEELLELIEKSDRRRAREKALYLLEHRAHSKRELVEKISAVCPREAAREAAEHMEEIGLVDDEAFAHQYAKELFTYKKMGRQRVRQALFQKGIDKEIIAEVIEEYGGDSGENALGILTRKYPLWQEDEKVKRRAIAALQRMGYSWEEIRHALSLMEDED